MITGQYTVIRTTEPDDAYEFRRLYTPERPRAFFLNRCREITIPTFDELLELLGDKEKVQNALYTVEDEEGRIRAFCSLGTSRPEEAFGEVGYVAFEDQDFASAVADESFAFLFRLAFERKRLNKVIAHCLEGEEAFRDGLLNRGFHSNGVQREIVYTLGRWHDLETFSLFRRETEYGSGPALRAGAVEA